ncbi:glycerol-3-phosphate phosphatase [Haemorhous mexicanus]|uniref:glycerol-3-phosphate phosphatase n=1 Tax=Haemorhous mexicanus TaxID=30427 RepID=UPI0028BE817D|nr:glycerol-3-phosphate phosphatase [Haemorhous mexicanus]
MGTRSVRSAANGEARAAGAGGGAANGAGGALGRGGAAMADAMAAGGPRRCRRLEGEAARAVLADADTLLFDCDGVLWRGEAAVSGAAAALGRLAAAGKRLCYVTNNSGRTRAAYTEKLRRLGFPPAEPRHIFSSAFCAARYLRQALPPGAAAYVLGSAALAAELEAVGIPHLGPGPAALPGPAPADWVQAPLEPAVRAVLVGFDEHFSYAKLCQALRYLLRGGPECLLVGTNRDHRLPLEGGAGIPGTGCLVKAVETAAQREAFIVGKPNRFMFDCVAQEFQVDPARTIMVGDRLDTDILMGNSCGLTTLLTLTGVTALDEVRGHQESGCPARHSLVPDYYVDSIADLLPALGQ